MSGFFRYLVLRIWKLLGFGIEFGFGISCFSCCWEKDNWLLLNLKFNRCLFLVFFG